MSGLEGGTVGGKVGGWLGGFGGPQVAALLIAGGLLVGALGGGIVSRGPSGQPATSTGTLSIYPCPDSGPALATVGSGQKFLVTGKNAEGSWVRIYNPSPDRTEAWVQAGPLQFDGSLDGLPVVPCSPVVAAAAPSFGPGESLTALEDNSPSPPPSTAPTETPGGPELARLAAGSSIAGGPARYCQQAPRTVTVSVRATDPSGIAGVTLSYRVPGASGYATKPMARDGNGDTWRATLATADDGISGPGSVRFFVTATDRDATAHSTRLPDAGTRSIDVTACANDGPTLTAFRTQPGTVFTNPNACQSNPTSTTLSVEASDVDDVDGVTLHYRLPGDNSFSTASMARSGDRWRATLSPVREEPNADGSASWYVVAKDDLGASTRSATRSFKVNRCDFEADIQYSPPSGLVCASKPTWFYASASDPDGINGSSMDLVYTYYRKDGTQRTASKEMDGNNDGRWYYQVPLQAGSNWSANRVPMTYYFRTTDRFGGTTRSDENKIIASSAC